MKAKKVDDEKSQWLQSEITLENVLQIRVAVIKMFLFQAILPHCFGGRVMCVPTFMFTVGKTG